MTIPKSKFNVGDIVNVKSDETHDEPFAATVLAVSWCTKFKEHDYTIIENNDDVTDGYTEKSLSLANETNPAAAIEGKNHE